MRVGITRAGGGAVSGSRPEFLLLLQDREHRHQHLARGRDQGFLGSHLQTETLVIIGDERIAVADVGFRHTFHNHPHHPVTVLRHPPVMLHPALVAYPWYQTEIYAELLGILESVYVHDHGHELDSGLPSHARDMFQKLHVGIVRETGFHLF